MRRTEPSRRSVPFSSTFKVLLCGPILARVNSGAETLSRTVSYKQTNLVTYAPVTERRVGDGMSISAYCGATMTIRDSTAADLLLRSTGGPEKLTAFVHSVGDTTFRLDRLGTALNEAQPGDERDTSTPEAMARTFDKLLFGRVLSPASKTQLRAWMEANAVADDLIRSMLPNGWRIGDKAGAGGFAARSIIAVLTPPEGNPFMVAIYITGNAATIAVRLVRSLTSVRRSSSRCLGRAAGDKITYGL